MIMVITLTGIYIAPIIANIAVACSLSLVEKRQPSVSNAEQLPFCMSFFVNRNSGESSDHARIFASRASCRVCEKLISFS